MSSSRSPRYAANLKWLFTELPFLDRFAAAAMQGFRAVEYASPYEFPPAVLRAALARHGLRQVLINSPASAPGHEGENGFACIPGRQQVFREGMARAIAYAQELDCRLIHLLAGRLPMGVKRDDAEAAFRENLAWTVDALGNTGIRCVLESLNQTDAPGYFLRSLDEAAGYVNDISTERLAILFDAYHCHMHGGDVLADFQRVEHLVAHIQFADAPGRHEPGTGAIPLAALIERIHDTGWQGWIGCEYRPRTSTVAGLDWRTALAPRAQ